MSSTGPEAGTENVCGFANFERARTATGDESMIMIHDVVNIDELAQSIEQLSTEIGRMRGAGPLNFQDVQKAVSALTRAQLVMNELERIEIRERGVSRSMAERFAALDSRLRAIRYELYKDLTNRKPSAMEDADTMPTTGAEDDSEAHHITG
jgi:hypothetical protein